MQLWPTATRIFLEQNASVIRTQQSKDTYMNCLRTLSTWSRIVSVEHFTEEQLVRFLNRASTSKNAVGRQLAPGTVARNRNILMQFFAHATQQGWVSKDPAINLKKRVPVKVRNSRQSHWLTFDQLDQVFDYWGKDNLVSHRNRVLIFMLAYTGMRKSEAAGLTWNDVNLATRQIHVFGKGEKHRTLGIGDDLLAELQEWRAKQLALAGFEPNLALFPHFTHRYGEGNVSEYVTHWSRKISACTVYDTIKLTARGVGIPGLSTHDMRRTLAGLMETQEYSLKAIQEQLGHASLGTTEKYLQSNPTKAVATGKGLSLRRRAG